MYLPSCKAIVHVMYMYVFMFVLHVYFHSCVYLLLVCYAHDIPCTCNFVYMYNVHVEMYIIPS